MGEHVAAPQALEHFKASGRRFVDMRHHRQAGPVGGFHGQLQGRDAAGATGNAAGTHLHADDHVLVLERAGDRLARVAQAQVCAFADHQAVGKPENAGEGNVEIGHNTHLGAFHDVTAKTEKIAGAGAAGIDIGGGAARGRQPVGVDAQGRAAPIDVTVQIDQTRRHQTSIGLNDAGRAVGGQSGADGGNPPVGNTDIHNGIDVMAGIDQPTASNKHVKRHQPTAPVRASMAARPFSPRPFTRACRRPPRPRS